MKEFSDEGETNSLIDCLSVIFLLKIIKRYETDGITVEKYKIIAIYKF